ncbi:phosphotransferase [Nocardiopsis trehalosi]|jgi:hypothetical protein|uniref:phosphotransferase n=1 Tax=Nocardiopsis trehalosi TaxID=109329 RepID=UPI001FDF51FD|nr:phosphotransferase [Nocardiopsis trehalosi]
MTEQHFENALGRLSLKTAGPVRIGLLSATVSGRAETVEQDVRWVRVAPVPDSSVWLRPDAIGEAQVLRDRVPMPRLLDRAAWEEPDTETGTMRTVRADVFEYVDAAPVSADPVIKAAPQVPDRWWDQLRGAHDSIRAFPGAGPGRAKRGVLARVRRLAGDRIDTAGMRWEPAHGDLHWANLLSSPELVVTDWEGYSWAPAGLDAATLLAFSLAHPPTAERVREMFDRELSGEPGRMAQVYVAAFLESAIRRGFHADLAGPLREHVRGLLR